MGCRTKSDVENTKQNIINILRTASGEKEDIAYVIYKEIFDAVEDGGQMLNFFLENSEQIESNEEVQVESIFSKEEINQYVKTYGKIIDGTLELLLKKELSKSQFYAELWDFIKKNPAFEESKIRAFVLFYIWIDIRVPYYEVETGIRMENDEYAKITKKLFDKIKKIRFILNIPTEQKTERASRLLNLLDEAESEKERVVLMAQILTLGDKSEMIISKLLREKVLGDEKM